MTQSRTKLNVLLATTDHLQVVYKKGVEDFLKFFKGSQSAFKGEKKLYSPNPGTIDIPTERSNKLVVTTVDEKFEWFTEHNAAYIDALFSLEKTNASGVAKANLVVDGTNWGEFTSLELLRLKSLLEHGDFKNMYENIPVRNEDEEWKETQEEMYLKRKIYESNKMEGVRKSTTKEQYILPDPNISKELSAKYIPQISSKDTVIELGNFSMQKFSGEWSHRQRAELLSRRSKLLTAVIEALKVANDVEATQSELTSQKLFNFLHTGNI